jgi:hypothetical protein
MIPILKTSVNVACSLEMAGYRVQQFNGQAIGSLGFPAGLWFYHEPARDEWISSPAQVKT